MTEIRTAESSGHSPTQWSSGMDGQAKKPMRTDIGAQKTRNASADTSIAATTQSGTPRPLTDAASQSDTPCRHTDAASQSGTLRPLTDAQLLKALEDHFALTDGNVAHIIQKAQSFVEKVGSGDAVLTIQDRISLYKALPIRWKWIHRGRGEMLSEYADGLTFSERVRTFRREMGMAQRQFGDLIGVADKNVAKYESGRLVMRLSTAEAMEERCGISAEWLLFGDTRKKGFPVTEEMENWISRHPDLAEEIWRQAREYQEKFREIIRQDAEQKRARADEAAAARRVERAEERKAEAEERLQAMLTSAGGSVAEERKTFGRQASGRRMIGQSTAGQEAVGQRTSEKRTAGQGAVGQGTPEKSIPCQGIIGHGLDALGQRMSGQTGDASEQEAIGTGRAVSHQTASHEIDYAGKLREIVRTFDLTPQGLGAVISRTNAGAIALLNGRTPVTDLELEKIMASFPVRKEWLLFDDGPMLEEDYDRLNPGQRLQKIRGQEKLSLQEFAERIGMKAANYASVERGSVAIPLAAAERIGDRLGVSVEYLLYGKADRRKSAVSQSMCDWLWEHPEVREEIRREMTRKAG